MDYVIEMLNIRKEFPGIVANDNITLQLKRAKFMRCLVKRRWKINAHERAFRTVPA